jgi:hypothetical protein
MVFLEEILAYLKKFNLGGTKYCGRFREFMITAFLPVFFVMPFLITINTI